MFGKSFPVIVAIVLACSHLSIADEGATIVRKSIEAQSRISEVENEKRNATFEISTKVSALRDISWKLKKPPTDELRAQMQQQITSAERRLKSLRKSTRQDDNTRQSILRYEGQIDSAQRWFALTAIKDEKKRNDAMEKFNKELAEHKAVLNELSEPFNKLIAEIKSEYDKERAAFKKFMEKFVAVPTKGPYAGLTTSHFTATFETGFAAWHWNDANNKMSVWTHIRLRKKPEKHHGNRKLDGVYPVQSSSNGSAWIWVGHFQIAFIFSKKELEGKDKPLNAIKEFIDIEAMAKVNENAPKIN